MNTLFVTAKRCTRCGIEKSAEDFNRRALSRDGLQPKCRSCESDIKRVEWEVLKTDSDAYATRIAKHKRWVKANPEKMRLYKRREHMLKAYGITLEQYEELVLAQDEKCALCFTPCDLLQVDHDHITGHIRGLLCGKCNRGLGLLEDDVAGLLRAVEYLRRAGS